MPESKIVKLEIPCSPEFVFIARKTLEGIASRIALTSEQLQDVKLAIGEACTNAIKFSSPEKQAIRVLYRIEPDRLEIEVQNTGDAFHWKKQQDSIPAIKKFSNGGLGIYLIHELMDELHISSESGVNTVKMVKYLMNDK